MTATANDTTQTRTNKTTQNEHQAYHRQLLLEKIMDENAKTERLLEQRRAIQEQRKAANMAASLRRRKVAEVMEAMRGARNIEKLAPGGRVDAALVASQLAGL